MEKEIWKDVIGYEGLYQVSNLGRIKSLPKQWLAGRTGHIVTRKEKILKPVLSHNGYKFIGFWNQTNKRHNRFVHQVVAESFLGHIRCGMGLVIDHINDNKLDNRVENLQIVTPRYNVCKTQGKYSSKYKGVCYNKKNKNYMSSIKINKKQIYLGSFKTEEEAVLIYEKALYEIENDIFNEENYLIKYKGFFKVKTKGKVYIYSQFNINKKTIKLGRFKTEEEAYLAYQNALKKYNV